jgi:undecaprenyl-diphosphatase
MIAQLSPEGPIGRSNRALAGTHTGMPSAPLPSVPLHSPAKPETEVAARGSAGVLAAGAVSLAGVLGLLFAEGRWEPLERLDTGVAGSLHRAALRHPDAVRVLRFVEAALQPNTFRVLIAVVAGLLWVSGRRNPFAGHRRRLAVWSAVVVALGGLLGLLLKIVVARVRPVLPDPVAVAGGYSFPSGHALNSALCCGILLVVLAEMDSRWLRPAMLAAAVVMLGIGFDRVALGVHFVSDVVAGWFVAGAVVFGGLLAAGPWRLKFRRRMHRGSTAG